MKFQSGKFHWLGCVTWNIHGLFFFRERNGIYFGKWNLHLANFFSQWRKFHWLRCVSWNMHGLFLFRERNVIPKIENFFEVIVPRMVARHFRRYFWMYHKTLYSIISYLSSREPFTSILDKGRICRTKKVAMTCTYLGSKQTIMHYVLIILFYFSLLSVLKIIIQ